MKDNELTNYDLLELLNENGNFQSWKAINRKTNRLCFLKCSLNNSDLQLTNKFLTKSYNHQKDISHPQIVTAQSKRIEEGRCIVEYPYLEPNDWMQLSCERFRNNPIKVLTQIACILDYIHSYNLVHCDIKFDNIFINSSDQIKLIDLDFLVAANSKPQGLLIGTPTFIPPEIETNDIILTQSDNYSLGKQIEKALDTPASDLNISKELFTNIKSFSECLLNTDPWNRSNNLIETLYKCNLIDSKTYQTFLRDLLIDILNSELIKSKLTDVNVTPESIISILNKKKIIIPTPEIVHNLIDAYKHNASNTKNTLISYLEETKIIKLESYWHLQNDDNQLFDFLIELKNLSGGELNKDSLILNSPDSLEQKIELIQNSTSEEDKYFKLFATQQIIDNYFNLNNFDNNIIKKYLLEFTQQAISLNRLKLALEYYEKLGNICELSLDAQIERIVISILLGELDNAKNIIKELENNTSDQIRLDIYKAWLYAITGKMSDAIDVIEEILNIPKSEITPKNYISSNYVYAIIHWMKGDYEKALKFLLISFEKSKNSESKYNIVSIASSLAILFGDIGDFNESIKYCKLAIKEAITPLDLIRVQHIYITLGYAYTRISDFSKAQFWLEKYHHLQLYYFSGTRLVSYSLAKGFNYSTQSNFLESKNLLIEAINLSNQFMDFKNYGKAYYNLSINEMESGNFSKCKYYLKEANTIFTKSKDDASVKELEIISVLNYYFNNEGNINNLHSIIDSLIRFNCNYVLCLCYFHQILNDCKIEEIQKSITNLFEQKAYLKTSDVPLFKVLYELGYSIKDTGNLEQFINVLKKCYRILSAASQKFLSALLAKKISELYESSNKNKHAINYLNEARKNFVSLKNETALHKIDDKLSLLKNFNQTNNNYLEHLSSISKIIKDIENYNSSLSKLLEFAVDQTGAERGVLFRCNEENKLQIIASVNCHFDNLEDIKDFSLQVPTKSTEEFKAVIIANALDDKRTKKYESIIQNNILSIISIPITFEDNVIGVLYLDHHTIPELFDKEDILFINSISNIIAIMLNTIIKYKTIKGLKEQYQQISDTSINSNFISRNNEIKLILDRIPSIVRSNKPVLIIGESGTGKEIISQLIYEESLRKDKPFLKINCSAISASMIESELFGVAQNVATGVKEREGKLSAADTGTLLFDEIGDMSFDLQSKLLRAIEYQEFEKVGSNRTIYTDIRFLYATNKNLKDLIRLGEFREDLFYRISTITINIPPLRERKEDIELLIKHFLSNSENPKKNPIILLEALKCLIAYDWPGNVRELKGVIDSLCVIYASLEIDKNKLPEHILNYIPDKSYENENEIEFEKAKIENAFIRNNGNQLKTAKELGIPNSTLRYKIKKYHIKIK